MCMHAYVHCVRLYVCICTCTEACIRAFTHVSVLRFSNVGIFHADILCRDRDSNLLSFGDLCDNTSPAR